MKKKLIFRILMVLLVVFGCKEAQTAEEVKINTSQGISLLNKPLIKRQIDSSLDSLQISNYLSAQRHYKIDRNKANNIIWLGRRIAYLGDYKRAIEVFTEGINKYPDDARFYRHRGHRYISTRQLDRAVSDFIKASRLIKNTDDIIEPDGIPNKLNTPVSTLHTNIWYHLGLAYYLQKDLNNAKESFYKCLLASKNNDMIVATTHWLYMTLQRLGEIVSAENLLVPITKDMAIIENGSYHNLLLFYKGILTEEGVTINNFSAINEAVLYGVGNWYYFNDDIERAKEMFNHIVELGNWSAFGYIAAEADLSSMEE